MAVVEKVPPLSAEQLTIAQTELAALKERVIFPTGINTVLAHLYRERPDDDPTLPDKSSQIVGRAIAIGIERGFFSEVMLVTDCSGLGLGPIAPRAERFIRGRLGEQPVEAEFIVRPEAQTTRHESEVFRRIVDERIEAGHQATHLIDIALAAHIPRVRKALAHPNAFGIAADTIQVVSAEDIIMAYGKPEDIFFLAEQLLDPTYEGREQLEKGFVYRLAQGPFGSILEWLARKDTAKGLADMVENAQTRQRRLPTT